MTEFRFHKSLVMDQRQRRGAFSAETFDKLAREAESLAGRRGDTPVGDLEVGDRLMLFWEMEHFVSKCAAAFDVAAAAIAAEEEYEKENRRLRRELGSRTRAEKALAELERRRRKWFDLRIKVRRELRNRPEHWNAETDRRLVTDLRAEGIKVTAKTIANQRTKHAWLD